MLYTVGPFSDGSLQLMWPEEESFAHRLEEVGGCTRDPETNSYSFPLKIYGTQKDPWDWYIYLYVVDFYDKCR